MLKLHFFPKKTFDSNKNKTGLGSVSRLLKKLVFKPGLPFYGLKKDVTVITSFKV